MLFIEPNTSIKFRSNGKVPHERSTAPVNKDKSL